MRDAPLTQCLLASHGDCTSKFGYGASIAWDPDSDDDVADLNPDNSCGLRENPENDLAEFGSFDMKYHVCEPSMFDPAVINGQACGSFDVLTGSDPFVDDELVLDVCVPELPACFYTYSCHEGRSHAINLPDEAIIGPAKLWYSGEAVGAHRWASELRWMYWAPEEVFESIWHNLADGPASLKVMMVQASGAGDQCDDNDTTKRCCSCGTDEPRDPRTVHADHFDFYSTGVPDPWSGYGPYDFMWDEFRACPGLWDDEDCPECELAGTVARGELPTGALLLSYYGDGDLITQVLPHNPIRHRDVVYMQADTGIPNQPQFEAQYLDLKSRLDDVHSPGYDEQFHISRHAASIRYRIEVNPPDDFEHDNEVTGMRFTVDSDTENVVLARSDLYEYSHPEAYDELLGPGGLYSDLAGAWFTIRVDFDSMDPGSGVENTFVSPVSRVLVMRNEGDTSQLEYPEPVPDVSSILVPDVTSSDTAVLLGADVFTVTTVGPSPMAFYQVKTAANPDPPGYDMSFLSLSVAEEGGVRIGTNHHYEATVSWNAQATWCENFPGDGEICGGPPLDPAPEQLEATIRIRAYNSEGGSFWVERDIVITRGSSAMGCTGYCGGRAAAGCWCDSLCLGFGDCCFDKVEVCGL